MFYEIVIFSRCEVQALIQRGLVLLIAFCAASSSYSDVVTDDFVERYAQIQINTIDESEERRGERLWELLEDAVLYRDSNPSNAEAWIATARVRFGWANTQGMLRGLRAMKVSRNELETALALDENSMGGFGKAFLGYLYAVLPGWPVSVGDVDKAEELLGQVVQEDEPNIAFNYFYGMYLIRLRRFEAARERLLMAKNSSMVLPDSPAIRLLYLNEIEKILVSLDDELN